MDKLKELLTEEELDNFLTNDKVVIEFFTTTCGKCKMVKVILQDLQAEYPLVKFATINAQNLDFVLERFEIFGFPTIIMFKNGDEVKRTSSDDETVLKECLKSLK
ncbi:hypothetical protein GJ496_011268 [Pomphorhynchus laevis]|nr:hypothetical protein GJ496_011259 [Pomphorhynchus laevis]KAI0979761.1 hypothetical protein GJ496_011268 [Pomphorhynchus laevis]